MNFTKKSLKKKEFISSLEVEIDNIIKEMNETTERNVSIVEDRIKKLSDLIKKVDSIFAQKKSRRIAVPKAELKKPKIKENDDDSLLNNTKIKQAKEVSSEKNYLDRLIEKESEFKDNEFNSDLLSKDQIDDNVDFTLPDENIQDKEVIKDEIKITNKSFDKLEKKVSENISEKNDNVEIKEKISYNTNNSNKNSIQLKKDIIMLYRSGIAPELICKKLSLSREEVNIVISFLGR